MFRKLAYNSRRVQGLILDWSGTTVDRYVLAPTLAFQRVFEKYNVPISQKAAREPMGLPKELHIRTILENPEVRERWYEVHKSLDTDQAVKMLYRDFLPIQHEVLEEHSELIPHTTEILNPLQSEHNIKIGITTGFPKEISDILVEKTAAQGFHPDVVVAGDEVKNGARPSPSMLWKAMDLLHLSHPELVVKIGDTIGDIGEGANAGCWTIGITEYGNYMNMSSLQMVDQYHEDEIKKRKTQAAEILNKASPDYIINTFMGLPPVLEEINRRLERGETPHTNHEFWRSHLTNT